eukprot:TRINITY_DN9975_c0_g1_i1.p1 TRINITY_DN9975_c0_g1~~TRINITY_DN9975_c0_g1_i1.p1  ORF type:complete len:121 (+),score=27.11 TRINITY_DN9975_c0_g1_i1:46-363(+)
MVVFQTNTNDVMKCLQHGLIPAFTPNVALEYLNELKSFEQQILALPKLSKIKGNVNKSKSNKGTKSQGTVEFRQPIPSSTSYAGTTYENKQIVTASNLPQPKFKS